MEEVSCLYCKNKIKIKGYKPNKKYCSLKCSYEYRKSSGYYKKYYNKRFEENRVIKYCIICENILPKGKSKYCSKQCIYFKLQLRRREKNMLKSGGENLSGLKIVKLNKNLSVNLHQKALKLIGILK